MWMKSQHSADTLSSHRCIRGIGREYLAGEETATEKRSQCDVEYAMRWVLIKNVFFYSEMCPVSSAAHLFGSSLATVVRYCLAFQRRLCEVWSLDEPSICRRTICCWNSVWPWRDNRVSDLSFILQSRGFFVFAFRPIADENVNVVQTTKRFIINAVVPYSCTEHDSFHIRFATTFHSFRHNNSYLVIFCFIVHFTAETEEKCRRKRAHERRDLKIGSSVLSNRL